MNKEWVSVIITTHNRSSELVLRAVNSVLNQTYEFIEIIVVDDSENDFPERNDVEQAVRNASESIIYIRHSANRGACAARNTGLKHANGYFVAFLDDDDEWLPRKIEEQIKGFTDNSIALVYCGFTIIDDVRNMEYRESREYRKGFVFDSLLMSNFVGNTSNPLIKKECLEVIGCFDTEMQSSQDYDLWLRIAAKYTVNYVPITLLNCHVHNNDHISADIDKKIAGLERINTKYNNHIIKDNTTWYTRYSRIIPFYVMKGWSGKAFLLWCRCVKKSPGNILSNIKLLLLIVFGYNSVLYQLYRRIRDLHNALLQTRSSLWIEQKK